MKRKNNPKYKISGQNYLLIAGTAFFLLGVWAYRHNNVVMVSLRDRVYEADKNNGNTEAALRTLREHVYSHMNTDLNTENGIKPPIQLQYRYERLVTAEKERVAAINTKLYTEGQNECERLNPNGFSGSGRISCIQEYVTSHGEKEQSIPDSLYKFDFVSPRWTFDLAGWSLTFAATILIVFLTRLLRNRHHLNKLYKF